MIQSVSNQSLYTSPGNIETRWASPENPTGERETAPHYCILHF